MSAEKDAFGVGDLSERYLQKEEILETQEMKRIMLSIPDGWFMPLLVLQRKEHAPNLNELIRWIIRDALNGEGLLEPRVRRQHKEKTEYRSRHAL